MLGRLEELANRVERIAEQTRQGVVDGVVPEGSSRIVSLHDPDAGPIRKGRLGRPVELGSKAQVVDNPDGIVVDWQVERGNPPDAAMLGPALERLCARTGKGPRIVTADRGYGEASVDSALHDLGVHRVVMPRKGRPGVARLTVERSPTFQGARTWTGHGIFAHNLVKIGSLMN